MENSYVNENIGKQSDFCLMTGWVLCKLVSGNDIGPVEKCHAT